MADESRLGAFGAQEWEHDASQFTILVKQLADSANARNIHEIEKQIQQIQRNRTGWIIGFYALAQDDPHVRFYGALTLTVKINSQWESLYEVDDGPAIILDCLRSRYVQLTKAGDHALVLRKLAATLSAFCLQHLGDWAFPVRDLLVWSARGNGGGDSGDDIGHIWSNIGPLSRASLRSLLWFCSTWIEEAAKYDNKTTAGAKVFEKAAKNNFDVWFLIHSVLSSSISPEARAQGPLRDFSDDELLSSAQDGIGTALSWTKTSDSLPAKDLSSDSSIQREAVVLITRCFWAESLAETTIEFLTYVVESAPTFQHYIPKDALREIILSPQVNSWCSSLLDEGDAPEGVRMATFIDAIVDLENLSEPDWVHEGSLQHILPILHAFLTVPGVPGIDNGVTSIALDIWTRVADGLSDWAGTDPAEVQVKQDLRQAVEEVFPKTLLKENQLAGHNVSDRDERTKFLTFRQDFDDLLLASYSYNADFIVEFVHHKISQALDSRNWAEFESSAHSLARLSEDTFHDERKDLVYQQVYDHQTWQAIRSGGITVPHQVLQAMTNLIAKSTKFLELHEQYLIPCLEFCFKRLSDHDATWLASEAIQSLCDSRRKSLVPALPQFFSALSSLDEISLAEQRPIFESVAAIIQALPSEEAKIEPLKELVNVLFRQGARLEEMRRHNDEDVNSAAASFVRSLAHIGRGLRAPDETVVALDDEPHPQSGFWISGSGAEVQHMILQALTQILQAFPSNEVTTVACEVFKAGYTEKDPFPFRFAPSITAQFLVPLIQKDHPRIGEILATASSFLASYAWNNNAVKDEYGQIIQAVCGNQRQILDESAAGQQSSDPDFANGSLELLESTMLRYGGLLLGLDPSNLSTIFEFAMFSLKTPDILPRRAATKFWAIAFDLSGYNSRLGPDVSSGWDQVLLPVMPHFASIIIQLVAGECSRSEIEAVSLPLKRFIEKQPNPARNLLKTLIDDPNILPPSAQSNVDSSARQAFVQKILMLRGAKKTDLVVREFWIACRGSNFAYTS